MDISTFPIPNDSLFLNFTPETYLRSQLKLSLSNSFKSPEIIKESLNRVAEYSVLKSKYFQNFGEYANFQYKTKNMFQAYLAQKYSFLWDSILKI